MPVSSIFAMVFATLVKLARYHTRGSGPFTKSSHLPQFCSSTVVDPSTHPRKCPYHALPLAVVKNEATLHRAGKLSGRYQALRRDRPSVKPEQRAGGGALARGAPSHSALRHLYRALLTP